MNIILITSIIDTPDKELSYTNVRSIYSKEDRYNQTKYTIQSVREHIPDNKILLIECSQLTEEEYTYFINSVDIFINIYDMGNQVLIDRIHSISKALGEGTMTQIAIQYLLENGIQFSQFFKISGRYWLYSEFLFSRFDCNVPTVLFIQNDTSNALTAFYHLPYSELIRWYHFLNSSETNMAMHRCIGYEVLFAQFLKTVTNINPVDKIGVSGHISVCGSLICT